MKNLFFVLLLFTSLFSIYAKGQQGDVTSIDLFSDYQSWTKVNQKTITGDETGVLGPAHERAKGFREIFVNEIGRPVAYGEADYPYPVGTILVKESYNGKDGQKDKLGSITAMVKREEGYDSENGDWEYVNANSKFKISGQGKIGMCINCHRVSSERDFVFWDSSF